MEAHWLHAFRLRTFSWLMSAMVISVLPACTPVAEERGPAPIAPPAQAGNHQPAAVETDTLAVPEPTNQVDARGLKQGLWVTDLKGKPWKRERYKDGQLHGEHMEYWANGEVMRTSYREGLMHGASMHYHPDSSVARLYAWYESGEQQWIAFPWELASYIVPVKGWTARKDSTEIRVPYVSGQLLYHGFLNQGRGLLEHTYGIHTAYYPDGATMAIIDYDQDSIRVYNRAGELLARSTPSKWQGNQVK